METTEEKKNIETVEAPKDAPTAEETKVSDAPTKETPDMPAKDSSDAKEKADTATKEASSDGPAKTDASRRPMSSGSRGAGAHKGKRNPRRPARGGRGERAKPEFDQKIVSIRRVVRVVSGGRRFSFSVAMVIGNRKGRVGVGVGKAGDTALAIDKAIRAAKRNMITVKLTDEMSVPHELDARFCSSDVIIMPAPGKGLVAGGAVRTVLDLAGVKNVSAKILSRSKNHLNNAQAALVALGQLAK